MAIVVNLSDAEFRYAKKVAEDMAFHNRQRTKRVERADNSNASLDLTHALGQVAVAKAFDLTHNQIRDPHDKEFWIVEFKRDDIVVPLWIKTTRNNIAFSDSVLFITPKMRYPLERTVIVACCVLNDFTVRVEGWAYSDALLKALHVKTTKYGTTWAVNMSDLSPIESFEGVFANLLQKMKGKPPWFPKYGRLSIPIHSDSNPRVLIREPI